MRTEQHRMIIQIQQMPIHLQGAAKKSSPAHSFSNRITFHLAVRYTTFQKTRSQAITRIADRTAKNCRGHVT